MQKFAVFGGVFIAFLAGFYFASVPGSGDFLGRSGGLVVKTLGDIFGASEQEPILEIALSGKEKEKNRIWQAADNTQKDFLPARQGQQLVINAGNNKDEENINSDKSDNAGGDQASSTEAKNASTVINPQCQFFSATSFSRKVLLNEIAWMGSPQKDGESASEAANREWIELKNNSDAVIDLTGWQIIDEAGKFKIKFAAGDGLAPGVFYLLERQSDDAVSGVAANKIYSGTLVNSGMHLAIFDKDCFASDEIDASAGWPAGDNTTKQTMERSSLNLGWYSSFAPGGTPGVLNSNAFSAKNLQTMNQQSQSDGGIAQNNGASQTSTQTTQSTASSSEGGQSVINHLIINQIQTTGGSGKADNDFIRIYNPTGLTFDIGGWKLRKRTQSGTESSIRVFPVGSSIGPQESFIWANSENDFYFAVSANVSSTATLTDNSSIALFDAAGLVIDAVAWGSGQTNPFVEASPYPENPGAAQVLSRKISQGWPQDTDNNAQDFEVR